MKRRLLTFAFLLCSISIFGLELPDSFTRDSLYDFASENNGDFYYERYDFDNNGSNQYLILVIEKVNRSLYDVHLYRYDFVRGEYKLNQKIGTIENIGYYTPYFVASLGFQGIPFPAELPSNQYGIILKDIDSDNTEELVLPYHVGLGSNYSFGFYKILPDGVIPLGNVEGLQTFTDVDNDGVMEFVGRTITDRALLSADDKTYSSYSLVNQEIKRTGYIEESQFRIIENQLAEVYRLFPDVYTFNTLLVAKVVHSPSLEEIIEWYEEMKPALMVQYSGDEEKLDHIKAMESQFINPVYLLLKGERNSEAMSIYQYRIVGDF